MCISSSIHSCTRHASPAAPHVGSISSSSSSSSSRPRPKPKLKPNPKQKADTEAGVVPVAEKQAGSQPDRLLLSGTLKQQFWELEVAGENPCKTVTQAVRVHHQQWQSLCLMPPVPPWRLSAAPMAPETVAPLVVPPVVPQPLAPRLVPAIVSQVLPRRVPAIVSQVLPRRVPAIMTRERSARN